MDDPSDPPRKTYGLKPKEFERVNAPPAPAPADPAAGPPQAAESIDVHALLRFAQTGGPLLSAHAPANRPNDVHALLGNNLTHADAAGLNDLAPRARRRSRRMRDYWLLLIGVNLFIFGIYCLQLVIGFQVMCLATKMPMEFSRLVRFAVTTPQLYVIPLLGVTFFSAALSWLMFGVMDDY